MAAAHVPDIGPLPLLLPSAPGPKGCIGPANSTNNTYCYNSNLTSFADSEAYCNTLGGHLPSWNSQAEQTEVRASCLGAA